MTLDPRDTDHDDIPALGGQALTRASGTADLRRDLPQITPDLVERLARYLTEANGEDPDSQPRPLRFPLWRYQRARAKTLLAISPLELGALAKVMGVAEPDRPTIEPPYIQ